MTTLIVVTGASRGLGRALCLSFAKNLNGMKHFVITGRDSIKYVIHKVVNIYKRPTILRTNYI